MDVHGERFEVSGESRWSVRREEFLATGLGNAMGEREFEILLEELLDVWTPNVVGLLNFDNFENLYR